MKLLVDRVTATPGPHHFEASVGWWREFVVSGGEALLHLVEPLRFQFSAHRMGVDLYLEGRASGSIEVECSRCLTRYRQALRDAFRLVLEPAGDRVPADPEGAAALARDGVFLGDEFESGWYRGSELRLDPFFAELIALAVPVQPLCREDCAGMCPVCGANRNDAGCECETSKASSPFAVLASLRGGRDEGSP